MTGADRLVVEPPALPGLDTTFRQGLLQEGLLLDLGLPGLYARSALFEKVVQALIAYVERDADAPAATWLLPPVFRRAAFEKTGYLRSFPDLIGSVHVFTGTDQDHAGLLDQLDSGADWTQSLTPSQVTLCSAGCHPLYAELPRSLPAGGMTVELVAQCFRHEPSWDPARMTAFRQLEFVHVGDAAEALSHRDAWIERAERLLAALGLPVERVVANDPFFGRAGRILASGQRAEELKYEIVCPIANADHPTAIASSNLHREHFGEAFEIHQTSGEVAHSACVGFGLERVVLALLRAHGLAIEAWPSRVRDLLALRDVPPRS